MVLMGLSKEAYWLSWVCTFQIYFLPITSLYAYLISTAPNEYLPALLMGADPSLCVVFMICYGQALVTFCFFHEHFSAQWCVAGLNSPSKGAVM
ncbi:hypothetical protein RRG08_051592 [Elysia crispata]|uniref:Uncharacterized protein n=1 Tax=Elysia crispata TaxID=231223 RepID=A0AAE1A2D4_9GAST|nr:hypothetical protein RRG08_051592 [Elysia crispata]